MYYLFSQFISHMKTFELTLTELVNNLEPFQLQCTVDNCGVSFNSFIHLF